jgi:hypothetical protein
MAKLDRTRLTNLINLADRCEKGSARRSGHALLDESAEALREGDLARYRAWHKLAPRLVEGA